jgi:Tol biopolymer transport system component
MTPDGQNVAFMLNGIFYVWNAQLNAKTYTNSVSSSSFPIVAISPNGQKVAYASSTPAYLYVADLVANTVTTVLTSASIQSHTDLRFSNDGRFLSYAAAVQNSAIQNVYLYDSQLNTNLLVSQNYNGAGEANTNSDSPAISPDGRFVAYRSSANTIVPFDFNNDADIFLYDTSNNATILISVNAAGSASANDRSLKPVFSADGRRLFFQSWSSDIAGGDFNSGSDLFALDLTGLPMTTGTGGSGATNAASGFVAQLILPAASVSNAVPAISWPLATGKSYQVQYKTNLADAVWLPLPGDVTFIGATGWFNDALPSPGQRFYRIVLSP